MNFEPLLKAFWEGREHREGDYCVARMGAQLWLCVDNEKVQGGGLIRLADDELWFAVSVDTIPYLNAVCAAMAIPLAFEDSNRIYTHDLLVHTPWRTWSGIPYRQWHEITPFLVPSL